MATTKTAYTVEQSAALVAAYSAAPNAATVESLAVQFGKSVKSIVAKLSREGVYVKAARLTKTGEAVEKKDETADAIGKVLGLSEADTSSLTKANKTALKAIFKALVESKPLD